jgi:hypothetical protein
MSGWCADSSFVLQDYRCGNTAVAQIQACMIFSGTDVATRNRPLNKETRPEVGNE